MFLLTARQGWARWALRVPSPFNAKQSMFLWEEALLVMNKRTTFLLYHISHLLLFRQINSPWNDLTKKTLCAWVFFKTFINLFPGKGRMALQEDTVREVTISSLWQISCIARQQDLLPQLSPFVKVRFLFTPQPAHLHQQGRSCSPMDLPFIPRVKWGQYPRNHSKISLLITVSQNKLWCINKKTQGHQRGGEVVVGWHVWAFGFRIKLTYFIIQTKCYQGLFQRSHWRTTNFQAMVNNK